ncbi:MAG: HAMP domain-containing sensor histidine kinase [Gemmatimonadales bacterium]|nr:HAMP domain-containing sensor histidine kinase [Gemmatimonadales bacterium]
MKPVRWPRLASRDGWRRAILIGTGTVVLLTVAAAVAAVRTRLHVRTAAIAALRNYATVAAEQFVNAYEAALRQNFVPIIPSPGFRDPVGGTDPIPVIDMVAMIEQMRRDPCGCLVSPGPTALFRIGPDGRSTDVRDSLGQPLAGLAAGVVATVVSLGDSLAAGGIRYGFAAVTTPLGDEVAFVTRRRDSAAGANFTYGFLVPRAHLAERIFDPAFRTVRLVPRHLLRTVAANDEFIALEVTGPDGRRLYATGERYRDGPTDALTLPRIRGAFTVRARLNPSIKDALIPGGIPGPVPWREMVMSGLALLMTVTVAAFGLRAAELARLRADFATSVTHELRTPLTQIRLAAETVALGRSRSPEATIRSMEQVVAETTRLQQLIDNVLSFSRAERRSHALEVAPTRLRQVVESAAERFAPLVADRRIDIRVEVPESLEVLADTSALAQIVLNLIDNAARYGPDGQTILIGAAARESRVELWVDDQGPGIAPRDRRRVWDPYVRLDRARDVAPTGTGLGLAVVRELAEAQGGSSRLEGSAAGGLRVVISLQPSDAG